MSQIGPIHGVIRFDAFEVDFHNAEVRKHGLRIRLQCQPFRIFQILLEHPGQVVSRDELRRQIWPADTFVDFEKGLNNAVKRLRDGLGDSAEQPRFIETYAKRGYRFIGSLTADDGAGRAEIVRAIENTVVPARPRTLHRWLTIGVGVFLAFVAILFGFDTGGFRQRLFVSTSSPVVHSLAVIPLANLSNDPAQEYFSDGLTDALITNLAHINSVRVISRTSTMRYKETKKTLPEIARELNVDGIIEGTVQRSGDEVRITAQLIYGPSDKHLWASSYERDARDIFALERDVTDDIARQVRAQITTDPQIPLPRPPNPKALDAYLLGNYRWSKYGKGSGDDELRKAAEYFQLAVDADPSFSAAYNGLASLHLGLLWPSNDDFEIAQRMVARALELEPNSSDAHKTQGDIQALLLDWPRAEQEYRQAIALNPNNALAHDELGWLLTVTGRLEVGRGEWQLAQELDPNYDHLSCAYMRQGQYDRAITMNQMMLARYPDDGYLHLSMFRYYVKTGKNTEAIQELEKMAALFGYPKVASRIHRAYANSGYRGALRQYAQELETLVATKQVFVPVNMAEVYATLGDKERAFYWLELAYSRRDIHAASTDIPIEAITMSFLLDPLRSDPRFKDLLRRIGLPPLT